MNGKIGGDSPISSRGNAYAQQLAEFFNEHVLSEHGPIVSGNLKARKKIKETTSQMGGEIYRFEV